MSALQGFYSQQFDTVLSRLKNESDINCHYHNIDHTLDVIAMTQEIGKSEGLTQLDLEILAVSALFHDIGYLFGRENHEQVGVRFFQLCAEKSELSVEEIRVVSECILATKITSSPQNQLQEIIRDADLDYLGRKDFLPKSEALYLELLQFGEISSREQWNHAQIHFLMNHRFYTAFSKENRIEQLQLNLEIARSFILKD